MLALLAIVAMVALLGGFAYSVIVVGSEIGLCLLDEDETPQTPAFVIGACGLIAVLAYTALANSLLS